MAIRFSCEHCQTLMSIASRKAGQTVQCPACDREVTVPLEDQLPADVPKAAAPAPPPAPKAPAAPAAKPPAAPPPAEKSPRAQRPDPKPTAAKPPLEPEADEPPLDRVQLPDDFFDFDDDEPPARRDRDLEDDESIRFATLPEMSAAPDDAEADEFEPDDPGDDESSSQAAELPPRPRSEEVAEKFTVPLRKSTIDDEMDLTPMVDVVFQLLIFFMVTASFALHKTIQTPTPDESQKGATQSIQTLDELEGVAILVRIDGQNGIMIDDEPLADDSRVTETLRDKMRKEQKSEIIITADSAAWHRTVVKVVDAANEVGMQKIRLATRSGPAD